MAAESAIDGKTTWDWPQKCQRSNGHRLFAESTLGNLGEACEGCEWFCGSRVKQYRSEFRDRMRACPKDEASDD